VRSVIRLQGFDNGLCGCGHIVDLQEPAAPLGSPVPIECGELGPVHEDGEFRKDIGVQFGEAPRQVIESRPEAGRSSEI
jgi:hypothetical protein